jgi:hypothetical protein
MAIVDLMFFASIGDIRSFFTLVIIGFLTSFFSKNMIVILFISLTLTHVLKYGTNVSEGMENAEKSNDVVDNSGNIIEQKKNSEPMTDLNGEKVNKKNKKEKEVSKESLQKDFEDFQSIQEKILIGMKEIDPLLTKAENFIEKFEQYKIKQNGGDPTDDD